MSAELMALASGSAGIVAGIVGGWAAARKAVGAANLHALIGRMLDERSRYGHEVLVAGDTEASAHTLAALLAARGFRSVRVVREDAPSAIAAGEAVVVYAAAPGADLSGRLLGAVGVVYVEGRVTLPLGDWSAANSRVTCHARTLEAIEYVRAERRA